VEETRSELFATGTWRAAEQLTLETGLRYERSRLTRSGDSRLETSLSALKPRLRVTYAAGAHDRFRALIEREVGQLDFEDFVSDPSVTSDAVTAGARHLVPESLWRGELTWEHHVGTGSIVVTARREWVSHVVDRIAVVTPEGVFDSVGNLGQGRRDELEADINLPLDDIGLKGLTVQGVALVRHSRVRDPETGKMRRISDEAPYEAQVELTQDLPAQRLRVGVTYVVAGAETKYKADEIEADRLEGRLEAFIEYKPDPRWTLRVFGRNLTDSASVRDRRIYDGLRRRDLVDFREVRILRSGPDFGLNVQRTFGG
jgi:outer membrane receptor protein involved in Fe transport